jgi:amino acid adenylation domain-containing protein
MTMQAILVQEHDASWALTPEQRLAERGGGAFLRAALRGVPDRTRLLAALHAATARHEIFDLRFGAAPGFRGLRMRKAPRPCAPILREEDCRGLSPEALLAATRRELAAPDSPLLAALLLRSGEEEWELALVCAALAADRLGLATVLVDICEIYAGADLEEPFQYLQFVEWRQALEAEAEDQRRYWSPYFERIDPPLPPFRATRASGDHASARLALAPKLLSSLHSLALARSVDLETLTQAAWWALLARFCGEGRHASSWLHDCRRDYDVMASAVGVFEKPLPLHIDASFEESFEQWLERFSRALDAHREAQEFWPVDDPPQKAHLQFLFAYVEPPPLRADGPVSRIVELSAPPGTFELAAQFRRSEAGDAVVELYYDAARYRPEAAALLLRRYAMMLEGAARAPTRPLRQIVLDEPACPAALVGEAVDFGDEPLPLRIARFAVETPEAPALQSSGGATLSYAALEERVARVAAGLQARGVSRGARIALGLPRSVDLVVALLAIWRVGASYVPIDQGWPHARREAVLADAALVCALYELDTYELADTDCAPVAIGLEDVAYTLYTSGSTGTPKGVVVGQGQLLNYVCGASRAMELDAVRRWALVGGVSADLGNTALFGALANGACLVVADDADLQDGAAFARFLREREIDGLKITPSQLDALLDGAPQPHLPRKLVLGGEAPSEALLQLVASLAPDCEIFNHYGPTETTVGVMVHRVTGKDGETAPLDVVLPNNRVYVLDADLRPVPTGAIGEICVAGAQLGRYLRADERGAFVDDPFAPRGRLYRTGDLACLLPEGGLRLLGRADDQLKIRGFRVEPAEIASALLGLPGVRQAFVAPRGEELCVYLVADVDRENGWRDLRGLLSERLPEHMLPRHAVFVETFPRLASGKIDRAALGKLDLSSAAPRRLAAPRDTLETLLCEGMAELLKREAIGVDEDFFDLGAHSLLVIKLVARIRRLLGIEIAPAIVFDHPTASELASRLRADVDPERLAKLAALHERMATMTVEERASLRERMNGKSVGDKSLGGMSVATEDA